MPGYRRPGGLCLEAVICARGPRLETRGQWDAAAGELRSSAGSASARSHGYVQSPHRLSTLPRPSRSCQRAASVSCVLLSPDGGPRVRAAMAGRRHASAAAPSTRPAAVACARRADAHAPSCGAATKPTFSGRRTQAGDAHAKLCQSGGAVNSTSTARKPRLRPGLSSSEGRAVLHGPNGPSVTSGRTTRPLEADGARAGKRLAVEAVAVSVARVDGALGVRVGLVAEHVAAVRAVGVAPTLGASAAIPRARLRGRPTRWGSRWCGARASLVLQDVGKSLRSAALAVAISPQYGLALDEPPLAALSTSTRLIYRWHA